MRPPSHGRARGGRRLPAAPATRPMMIVLAALAVLASGCVAAPATTSREDAGSPPATALPADQEQRQPAGSGPARPPADAPSIPRDARPQAVLIGKIGVAAPLIRLGLDRNRRMEVPKDFSVAGWYTGGPRPGEVGPAVIAGHVDSKRGPAVFYRLGELRKGDRVVVRYRGGLQVASGSSGPSATPRPRSRPLGSTAGPPAPPCA
jgi:hypothetical protein